MLNDALGGGGVGLHIGGVEGEVAVVAHVLDGGDQHEGTQALHAAALLEVDLEAEGEALRPGGGSLGGGGRAGRRFCGGGRGGRWRGFRHILALNFSDQGINICKETVDILIKRLVGLHLLHFAPEEVDGLEYHVEQRRAVFLGHHGHGVLPDDEEHILNPVGHRGQGVELHHGGGALDGVHDAEDLVHILLGEGIRLFRLKDDGLQLLQQSAGFVDVHIQDFISAAHKKAPPQ